MIADWEVEEEERAKAELIGSEIRLVRYKDKVVVQFRPLDSNGKRIIGHNWASVSGRDGVPTKWETIREAKAFVEGILHQARR